MFRRFVEQISGIHTGSDAYTQEDQQLQHQGLIGCGHFGTDEIWITKSHFPNRIVETNKYECEKIVCLVRNPIDVVPSYLNLFGLASHSAVSKKPWNQYPVWPQAVKSITRYWNYYHTEIRKQANKTPTFYVTYEELIVNPIPLMSDLFCFMLDVESIKGTILE